LALIPVALVPLALSPENRLALIPLALSQSPRCYELMGFQVIDEDGQVSYYCFVVLVFGLKVAAQVLCRVLKPSVPF
jgi:hypothetical protein